MAGDRTKEAMSSSLPLDGRVAIVTGASGGIGRAVSIHLHSLGARVVINYASKSNQADLLASELNASAPSSHPRAIAIKADVSDPDQVKQLFSRSEEEFGSKIHILAHCAGVLDSKYPTLANTAVEDWDTTFNVNTKGAFLCCREATDRLAHGGGGRIIMITSSLVGSLTPGYAAYTASKAAVETMTRIVAKELKGTGITANCVAPGKSEETIKRIADACPMNRLGEPEDISKAVGFIACDSGEWINGQEQADLVANDINSSCADNTPRAIVAQANVSDPAQVKFLFDEAERVFGSQLHVLVNCAGVLDPKYPSISNTSLEDFDHIFSVNTRGAFLCCKEAANRLKRGGGGRIIFLSSSMVGGLRPGFGAYAASKAAVETMIRILAKELKGTGITANCIAPGPIATEMYFAGKTEEQIKKNIEESPLGRLGETKDIAEVVGFMATDASEWINGQVIRANGGYDSRLIIVRPVFVAILTEKQGCCIYA
ncbi:hypothetical protein SADUNF_Sadunf13G0049500 [Salix dunnii]|uniref:Ketoreductase domain-containing protein n=1 Tax=Salix dunnii TaxID=1413687 RepID=A0A835JIE0_9ROSI|nr:hypothetical protein SADUNF_Sadunf13G0049500 [Salix dunnii]